MKKEKNVKVKEVQLSPAALDAINEMQYAESAILTGTVETLHKVLRFMSLNFDGMNLSDFEKLDCVASLSRAINLLKAFDISEA